jgi:hypothetical protein
MEYHTAVTDMKSGGANSSLHQLVSEQRVCKERHLFQTQIQDSLCGHKRVNTGQP